MTHKKIRVGIIGLNPDGQWASRSHYPALKFLSEDFELAGVANSTFESAQKTASALGISKAFKSAEELIQSPDIDLVTITVKVAHHFKLVKLALEAGKHVYCEHPLGINLDETKLLSELAAKTGLVTVVGNQMLFATEILYLEKLIKENYVGKVLSTSLIGSGIFWTGETSSSLYYMSDKTQGASMLTIPVAHTLAGLQKILGDVDSVKAKFVTTFKSVKLKDTREVKTKTAEDQILLIGDLKNGAAFSLHYRAGLSRATNFLWEINGTEGDIQITASLGHPQFAQLSLKGARADEKVMQDLNVPKEFYDGLPDTSIVRNVVGVYKSLAGDIRCGSRKSPTFSDAVKLYELLEKIEKSATE